MPARVHVYAQGPRLRALCATLVRDALPGVTIAEFSAAEAALDSARRCAQRTIVLDGRVAPDEPTFRAFAEGPAGVAAARGFDGAVRETVAAVVVDPVAPAANGLPPAIGDWLEDPAPPSGAMTDESVEVHSPAFGYGGYASAARNTIVGLHRAGVRVAWKQFYPEREASIDAEDRALMEGFSRAEFRASRAILIQPPTHVTGQLFLDRYVDAYSVTPYACYTMFETDAVPARWPALLARGGRVWVPSRFNAETFTAAGVPADAIDYVPLGLEVERFALDGERLDVEGRRGFAFLSVFGFTTRKGWDILIEAWARAFSEDDDVSLLLRTSAPNVDVRGEIERVMRERRIDPARIAPVVLLEEGLSAEELGALYRSADAFVLPSRGEGVGLPYLEAMAFGLPTIGTAWSGATEFLNEETGLPIECGLTLVDRMTARTFPILRDQHWAAPSVESTARRLREVFEDRATAAQRAARGCALARTQYNRTRTGRVAAAALQRIVPHASRAFPSAAVSFTGDLFSTSSHGARARALIAALESVDVPVAAIAEGVDQRAALFLDDARRLKAALERSADGLPAVPRDLPVPEAIDVERWTPQLGGLSGFGPATTLRFLTTAHLNERSGYDRTIGAFLQAFEPSDDVMLAVKVPVAAVDGAHAQALVAAAAARHAPHRSGDLGRYRISILAGIVPEGDYMQMLGSFDVFVHVPYVVGSSRTLLEAMASGLPCIRLRSLDDGIARSETTAFMVDDDLEAIAGAMRAIAADPVAAAERGHAARRAVIERHSLNVVGKAARRLIENIAGTLPPAQTEPAAERAVLGVILDRRGTEGDASALLGAMTRNEFREVVLSDRDGTLFDAASRLSGCKWIAYLRGDARVTQSWDVVLADALDSRPFVRLAVPRILDAPPPQGLARPDQPLADFARGLSVTQVGRGSVPASIVTTCVMFESRALLDALRAAPERTIESAAQAVAAGGRAAWCAFDVVIARDGDRPWPALALA